MLVGSRNPSIAKLAWLQHDTVTTSPSTPLASLDKLVWLRSRGIAGWDLRELPPC
jgi:hypothetical protein